MKAWIDKQIAQGGYGTVSEYFRQLLREEQKRQLREEIDAKLLAALDSGQPIPATPEFWDERRQELEQRIKKNKKA
jgi:antitoxin ParD1/3/4